ncbi:MAG: hemerythrin domain-containing protein [Candidatus Helarchaeota archaeon]|nr:hemerythrin domain-containing protein [Candidatus Helarchaeota archaeon]
MVMPIGPLMIEHRLIDRMIALMKREIDRIERENKNNFDFIDSAVDFIRKYADRCHHGKEEDILFRELKKKDMEIDHKRMMEELIADHKWARETTAKLVAAKIKIVQDSQQDKKPLIDYMKQLVEFYPKHIEKEDKRFFRPIMKYFSDKEQDALLQEEYEFDKNFIHVLYRDMITKLEKL